MPLFTPNYPFYETGYPALLSTPERTDALPHYTGRGVVMAFIDSGFYPHPDLEGRILVHADASTNHVIEQKMDFTVNDLSWHGQMTSVIAAGDGRASGGKYRGIASGARLVLVKVSTPRGQIKERDILRGLRWLLDTHRRFQVGADAITVGGINDHNSRDIALWTPYHHNYGRVYDGSRKPDILAPANWIASPILPDSSIAREARWLAPLLETSDEARVLHLLKRGYHDLGLPRDAVLNVDETTFALLQQRIHAHKVIDAFHQHVDGTSVAAPIVASIIAQMLEAHPGLTPRQIRAILTETARRLPGVPPEKQGSGVINAAAAVMMAARLL